MLVLEIKSFGIEISEAARWDLKVEWKFSSFLGCSPHDARCFSVRLAATAKLNDVKMSTQATLAPPPEKGTAKGAFFHKNENPFHSLDAAHPPTVEEAEDELETNVTFPHRVLG